MLIRKDSQFEIAEPCFGTVVLQANGALGSEFAFGAVGAHQLLNVRPIGFELDDFDAVQPMLDVMPPNDQDGMVVLGDRADGCGSRGDQGIQ